MGGGGGGGLGGGLHGSITPKLPKAKTFLCFPGSAYALSQTLHTTGTTACAHIMCTRRTHLASRAAPRRPRPAEASCRTALGRPALHVPIPWPAVAARLCVVGQPRGLGELLGGSQDASGKRSSGHQGKQQHSRAHGSGLRGCWGFSCVQFLFQDKTQHAIPTSLFDKLFHVARQLFRAPCSRYAVTCSN